MPPLENISGLAGLPAAQTYIARYMENVSFAMRRKINNYK